MTTMEAIEDQINEIAAGHRADLAQSGGDTLAAIGITAAVTVAACLPDLRIILWPCAVLAFAAWLLAREALRDSLLAVYRQEAQVRNEHA